MAERTQIGREVLDGAQKKTGLSNERIARLIPVSEKTWRRWKDAGEVPTAVLPRVAEILNFELRHVDGESFEVALTPPQSDLLRQLADAVRTLERSQLLSQSKLDELLERLDNVQASLSRLEAPPRRGRTRNGGTG